MIKLIKDGGICSPKGFMAAGVHCGIRKNRTKKDLALVFSSFPSSAAAIYTTNLVKAAPLLVTKKHLKNGTARAIIVNSGIANACVKDGIETASAMTKITANALGLKKEEILVASTGVIGQSLNLTPIKNGMGQLVSELSENGGDNATEAIMTTDTFPKQVAAFFELNGKTVTIGGMAKGSGMINPNMATLLGFLTTDAFIDAA
ncbi:MAG: bifunctional ornithine acetyltransferase/N-acetylglutamate synthase, partial [Firmicutes bacterium]|nr:bifunctional ornithine acetyltransferase/N-acetylglutamate synthase [Bacillota bacterium]